MKRFVLSVVALSMLALPTVQAQAAPRHNQPAEQHVIVKKKVVQKHSVQKHGVRKHEANRHHVRKPVKHWSRGQHVPSWQRKQVLRDYRHHGLRRPGAGQHWVKVDNNYLLIGITSGVIARLIAAN